MAQKGIMTNTTAAHASHNDINIHKTEHKDNSSVKHHVSSQLWSTGAQTCSLKKRIIMFVIECALKSHIITLRTEDDTKRSLGFHTTLPSAGGAEYMKALWSNSAKHTLPCSCSALFLPHTLVFPCMSRRTSLRWVYSSPRW